MLGALMRVMCRLHAAQVWVNVVLCSGWTTLDGGVLFVPRYH